MTGRVVLTFIWLGYVSAIAFAASVAADTRPMLAQHVQAPGLCWDPDVEFPVPCEDDD
jgi:hypothetical protein